MSTETKPDMTDHEASVIMRERLNALRADVMASDDYQQKIMMKYPRLIAHLICQSLGYFCPRSAANAIARYQDSQPFYCEWYCHMAGKDTDLLTVGKNTLKYAFEGRHSHKGYMADYWQARMVCYRSLKGSDPLFASWF